MVILRVNNIEVKALAEEQQVDTDIFEEMYRTATAEPYSFLFINLTKPIPERYYERFDHRLEIEENADEN
jgi:transcription initiation factor TFIIIB Brf1 subunit/transcription initiation factor TFIIB